ncbi:hypothetical protein ACRHK7_04435 [Weissella tructae]|uniref:Uncharacterized protein n=2 Tax=Weissella TaxID=46255 RepID=A0A075TYU8_9LACO|nr:MULTISPECIES: hypothetical protein [Weissella]AIG65088.1 hypothetical protein WS08_0149 [Weissella tructae]AIM62402.1 hypothetical protein WS74_0150 [Weissella ceti]AIM63739.1 hypothetical protein WS105_0149 [Weissella ceti]ELA07929.1 hypothetical protein WCNC_00505 [Weissella ceti NC36]QVV91485.1 hypothetical protein KHQ32_00875 [Weissella tructae]
MESSTIMGILFLLLALILVLLFIFAVVIPIIRLLWNKIKDIFRSKTKGYVSSFPAVGTQEWEKLITVGIWDKNLLNQINRTLYVGNTMTMGGKTPAIVVIFSENAKTWTQKIFHWDSKTYRVVIEAINQSKYY